MAKRRPANKGKKCTKRRRVKVKYPKTALRCVQWGSKTKKKAGATRRMRRKKKCPYGVSKTTGKCLKNPRRKKMRRGKR